MAAIKRNHASGNVTAWQAEFGLRDLAVVVERVLISKHEDAREVKWLLGELDVSIVAWWHPAYQNLQSEHEPSEPAHLTACRGVVSRSHATLEVMQTQCAFRVLQLTFRSHSGGGAPVSLAALRRCAVRMVMTTAPVKQR